MDFHPDKLIFWLLVRMDELRCNSFMHWLKHGVNDLLLLDISTMELGRCLKSGLTFKVQLKLDLNSMALMMSKCLTHKCYFE